MKHLIINNIPIDLERKRIKNMYLKVLPPDGHVSITAPMRMSEEKIRGFVMTKLDWIELQQERLRQRNIGGQLRFVTGDDIYLWGQKYILEVISKDGWPKLALTGDKLLLTMKEDCSTEQRKKVIDLWYKEQLLLQIPILIMKWEKIIGVKTEGFSVRDMKTRWGTCNIRTKKICISLQLAKKKPRCLEYVVVHELVHLLEHSHNSTFKAYLDRFLPEWRSIKKEMNGMTVS
jgi:predicted metal-dependent hydrolase